MATRKSTSSRTLKSRKLKPLQQVWQAVGDGTPWPVRVQEAIDRLASRVAQLEARLEMVEIRQKDGC